MKIARRFNAGLIIRRCRSPEGTAESLFIGLSCCTNGASLEFQDFPKTYEIRTSNGHVVQIEADKYLQTKKRVRFGRPFGTCALRALDPGVETPGIFSFVPSGWRIGL